MRGPVGYCCLAWPTVRQVITVVVYRIPGNVPEVSRALYYGYYRYFLLFIIVITNECLCHRTICVVVLAIFTHLYVVRYFCH